MALSRADLVPPSERHEAIEVEGLGEVIVRQLHLHEAFALEARRYERIKAELGEAAADEAAEEAEEAAEHPGAMPAVLDTGAYEDVVQQLAWCVIDKDGVPLLSVDEWRLMGARLEMGAMLTIVAKIRELSRPEKKTAPAS